MPKNHLQNRYDLRQIVARRVGKCVTMRQPCMDFPTETEGTNTT